MAAALERLVRHRLTGRAPVDGANPMDVIIAHARDEVVWPQQHELRVPADLKRVIHRCLAKRREDRFQDVDSSEQALAECAAADQWTHLNASRWWHENDEIARAQRTDDVAAIA
jgi:hypothetical protein